jgi:16S rRNA processing protein RimM
LKKDSLVSIGKIIKSQGRKGELRLRLYSRPSATFFFSRIFLKVKGIPREFQVEAIRPYKEDYILKLKEVDSLDRALELTGEEIFLPEDELRTLEDGNFYYFQIIGCTVIKKNGEKIGVVRDLWPIRENELLVVQKGKDEMLIPFAKPICLEVNLERREILVDLPPGLSDLNEI